MKKIFSFPSKSIVKKIIYSIIIWRLVLGLASITSNQFLEKQDSFVTSQVVMDKIGLKIIHGWANFDGFHYITIHDNGYQNYGSLQAFFPVYPILIKWLTLFTNNPVLSGVFISTLSFILANILLYQLVILDDEKEISIKTFCLILLFPTAFFFTAVYTESLFFLFVVASFYLARKKHWLYASLVAALASATKVTGIILLPALIIEYFDQKNLKQFSIKKTDINSLLAISISSSGLLSYMYFLYKKFSDPLMFLHVQEQFGAGRQTDKLVMLYQVFFRYLKMIVSVDRTSYIYYNVISEFIVALLFLVLLLLAFKHTRKSYAFYGIVSFVIPTLTGTFTSLPRYVLVLFPAFVVLAKILKDKKYKIFLAISGILLIVNTILFIQGRWIA